MLFHHKLLVSRKFEPSLVLTSGSVFLIAIKSIK